MKSTGWRLRGGDLWMLEDLVEPGLIGAGQTSLVDVSYKCL